MSDLQWLGAAAAARAFAARQLSPVALMQALLAHIAALDPKINAFIRLDADAADALAIEQRMGRFEDARPRRQLRRRLGRIRLSVGRACFSRAHQMSLDVMLPVGNIGDVTDR